MCPSYSSSQRAAVISVLVAKVERGWAAGAKKRRGEKPLIVNQKVQGFWLPLLLAMVTIKGRAHSLSASPSCKIDLAMGHIQSLWPGLQGWISSRPGCSSLPFLAAEHTHIYSVLACTTQAIKRSTWWVCLKDWDQASFKFQNNTRLAFTYPYRLIISLHEKLALHMQLT